MVVVVLPVVVVDVVVLDLVAVDVELTVEVVDVDEEKTLAS